MSTILLGWELGGGLGHVRRLLHLARALADHGHRPVLAVRNIVGSWRFLRESPFTLLQAPLYPRQPGDTSAFLATSYTDILALCGFASVDDLQPLVRGWQALLDLVRPDLVIADHSPTLCLAAYRTLPTVIVGSGFTAPPVDGTTFPALVLNQLPLVPQEQVLEVVQEVQRRRQRPEPFTLPGLFAAAERFVTVLPEMDPYHAVRQEPCLGPIGLHAGPAPSPAEPRYFAYLSTEVTNVEPILAGLAKTGIPGSAYVHAATPQLRARCRGPRLDVLDIPADLDEVLARVTVVVHHGNGAVAQHALLVGRPQLAFPQHLEHILNAQMLHRLGVGSYLAGHFAADSIPQALRQVASEPRFTEQAQAVARSLASRGPWDPLNRIVERCLALCIGRSIT